MYSVTGSGKRPIYWLFDSGKQNGFKALIYLQRYTSDTIGNLRVDYLHRIQRIYESEIDRMQDMIDHSANAREAAAASKRKDKLVKQLKECREYDEKIGHLALSQIELDLDDDVKVNYRKLQTAYDGEFYEVLADSKNIMAKKINSFMNFAGGSNMAEDMLFLGESKNVEYKVTVPEESEKYMKTVVAFANGRGGRIVFGIDDKTLDIVGMDVDNIYKTMDAITNAISDSCEPAIRPDVAMQTFKDKTVIVVEILPGAERPYYIKSQGMVNGTYVRVSGTTRHVEDYMLKELILEGKNRHFDSEICQNMSITDNEIEALCKSMKETAIRNTWQDSEKAKIKDITKNVLISWDILKEKEGNVYSTNAFALLTGRMFQQPVIQCGVFKGTTRAHFVDRREFEGSIQEQMEAAYQYVLEKINMGMTIKGMYRQDVYELPTDSIRELIANAVAHRSYLEPGNIQVVLFDDRLEVTSPGMLLNNVTIAKMMEGYSKPRNPAIARAFAYMKIIEKWGTGIPRLFEECEEYGLPKPELIDFDGDFRVNMYRRVEGEFGVNGATTQTTQTTQTPQSNGTILSDDDKRILELVHNHPSMSQKEYANELGWSVDRVKYYLRKMKTQELIKRVGSSHNGYWEVLSEMNKWQN